MDPPSRPGRWAGQPRNPTRPIISHETCVATPFVHRHLVRPPLEILCSRCLDAPLLSGTSNSNQGRNDEKTNSLSLLVSRICQRVRRSTSTRYPSVLSPPPLPCAALPPVPTGFLPLPRHQHYHSTHLPHSFTPTHLDSHSPIRTLVQGPYAFIPPPLVWPPLSTPRPQRVACSNTLVS